MDATRIEAERLLGVAERLLQNRDLNGSRDFANLAQETEPLLEGSDQILAVIDVLLAADKRVNNHHDWYAILQLDRRSTDFDLIRKQYRRLALLLHPDKNRFSHSDHAFRLVAEAWAVLSDQAKKANFDKELSFFTRVDLSVPTWVNQQKQHENVHVRTAGPGPGPRPGNEPVGPRGTFWTTCPYCYYLYEYPKVYENCCLRCQNCEKSFHGVEIPKLPPIVEGQEAYHCCWGFFPMGFYVGNNDNGNNNGGKSAVPVGDFNSPPPVSTVTPPVAEAAVGGVDNGTAVATAVPISSGLRGRGAVLNGSVGEMGSGKRKRGRPKRNPLAA